MSAKGGTYQHLMIAELKILLNNHWTLIVLAVYVLFTCGVYFSEALDKRGYKYLMETCLLP